jgi:16S rRNA (cytidine1402-2'-O)-methyltransferase
VSLPERAGAVYVVATPIGNLEDLSARARRVLEEVAVIACEDTRRTARLCTHAGIRTPRISLHGHNETRRIPSLLRRVEEGDSIAVVSDAGTPLLSDPGARLVSAAAAAGLRVIPVPGPSAILAALVASALPVQPFTFLGFPPRKGTSRQRWLENAAGSPGTIVLFEAPGRVRETLGDLHRILGSRRVSVGRELTKRFEEVIRGRLGDLELPELRGEVTVVVEGSGDTEAAHEPREIGDELLDAVVSRGEPLPKAARELARATGISRQDAYRLLLERSKL